jgi:hypothetical protein
MSDELVRARKLLRPYAKTYLVETLARSTRAEKRFQVRMVSSNELVHFGSVSRATHFDKPDEAVRAAWRARHARHLNSPGPGQLSSIVLWGG